MAAAMKRAARAATTVVLLAVLLTAAAGTALAQEADSSSGALAQPRGEPPINPPNFVLEEDGTVIVDGDQVTNCRSFIIGFEQGGYDSGLRYLEAQKVIEKCEELGLSSGGNLSTHDSEVVLYSGGELQRDDSEVISESDNTDSPAPDGDSGDSEALPDTSGLSLLPLATGLLLASVGLFLIVYRRT